MNAGAFQSTPSGGKATGRGSRHRAGIFRVSIHAFRGEGDGSEASIQLDDPVFQSTPSGGKATETSSQPDAGSTFQSTPSGGKATAASGADRSASTVSIHAFRGEGDAYDAAYVAYASGCFNPRLPGGRRPSCRAASTTRRAFQSTPSGGKATFGNLRLLAPTDVSIHAFRGEGDVASTTMLVFASSFNPRLPGGRRPPVPAHQQARGRFQSTPSGGKATIRFE